MKTQTIIITTIATVIMIISITVAITYPKYQKLNKT
jgi:hypothetical protein